MTLSSSILPAVENMFAALDNILDKAAARCETTKVEESVYLAWRMAPDMLPLAKQVRIATEIPARSLSRIAGADLPSFSDDEQSFAELRARIEKARAIVQGVDKAALDADPDAEIAVPMGTKKAVLPRAAFAHQWIMPNLYFHVTTAYLILRHLGVDLGKADFLIAMHPYIQEA